MSTEGAHRERDPIALWASYLLIVLTFAGSYGHVVDAVRAAGQHGWFVYVIAAIPEILVALGMRKLVVGERGLITWVSLVSGGAFTLTGNLHGVEAKLWPLVVAGLPAYAAGLAVALAGVHGKPVAAALAAGSAVVDLAIGVEPVPVARPRPVPRPVVATPEPVAVAKVAAAEPTRTVATATVADVADEATPTEATQAEPVAIDEADPVVAWLREHWANVTGTLPAELATLGADATGTSARTVRRRAGELRRAALAGGAA